MKNCKGLILLLTAILLLAVGCQSTSQWYGRLEKELPLDPLLIKGRLDNGLTCYIRKHGVPQNRMELRLVVRAGSVQEDDNQKGFAHFVEHMAFNGTKNFRKQEIINYLQSIGMRFGPEINAYTSYDETVYKLHVPTGDPKVVETGMRILYDWAYGISFESEEVEKEKGVVIEEWRRRRGADERIWDKHHVVLFNESKYAQRRVLGDMEMIKNSTPQQLREFYNDWYRPDLMAVIAVGDFDEYMIRDYVTGFFSGLKGPDNPRSHREEPVPFHRETLYSIATDPETARTYISFNVKHEKTGCKTHGDLRIMITEDLFMDMLNNRFKDMALQPSPYTKR
jgi:zinc protease